jgi:hypothetical protein
LKTYDDWVYSAAYAGIDWKDEPPPREMITDELCIADLQDAPEHLALMPEFAKTEEVCFWAARYDEDVLPLAPGRSAPR